MGNISCNYCQLIRIKDRAKETGNEITTFPCTIIESATSSFNVYVHPKFFYPFSKKYFTAWFMEVGDKCECEHDDYEIEDYLYIENDEYY